MAPVQVDELARQRPQRQGQDHGQGFARAGGGEDDVFRGQHPRQSPRGPDEQGGQPQSLQNTLLVVLFQAALGQQAQ